MAQSKNTHTSVCHTASLNTYIHVYLCCILENILVFNKTKETIETSMLSNFKQINPMW